MLGVKLRDRYYIIKELGVGGFGQTFLAKDCDFPGKPWCVVKQLKPQVDEAWMLQTARRLFDLEASVLAHIGSHPQIPQLKAHFEEEQQFYLVQEFIEGTLLSKEMKGKQRWSQKSAIAFLEDILPVLKFIHDNQVIHRDLKPENIIRRQSDNKLVLIDFGSVKKITKLQEEEEQEHTGFTVAIGTPSYMPIEQQGGQPSYNSDIYALGKIVIQGLSGLSPKRLAEDPTTGELLWQHLVEIDDAFANVLTGMVKVSPRERYQNVNEIIDDLNLRCLNNNAQSHSTSTKPSNPVTLNHIVHQLKQHPEITRIKKMLFCACKHRWENSSQVLIKYRTKSLLQELYQREPNFSAFEKNINGIVSTLNKKDKYQVIANIILEQVKLLYDSSNALAVDDSENSDGIPSQFTALKSETLPNPEKTGNTTHLKRQSALSQNPDDNLTNVKEKKTQVNFNSAKATSTNYQFKESEPATDKTNCNIFDLRYEVTRYTTPLRIKILLFSMLYYKIDFNEQDWSLLINHQLDSLLNQAIKAFPTLSELENRLYATARHFEEKEGLTQTVGAIIQSIRPFYENGQPQLIS